MLGERIKELRLANRLSQVELASALNVTKQSVSNWENDNIQPSVELVKQIAIFFHCSVDFLLELDTSRKIIDVSYLTTSQVAHIQQIIDDLSNLDSPTQS
ncbi:MAG: helix-turn-helix transcriptional regulator [Lachnospiraceae bacterium]|nr:helix-turn-helix transcriptional regulator [Lachnospiraceae bacterium]